jgi:hypothetical protein
LEFYLASLVPPPDQGSGQSLEPALELGEAPPAVTAQPAPANPASQPQPPSAQAAEPVYIRLASVSLVNAQGRPQKIFNFQEQPLLEVDFEVLIPQDRWYANLAITDSEGNILFVSADNDLAASPLLGLGPGAYSYRVPLPAQLLKPGQYNLGFSITALGRGPYDRRDHCPFQIVDQASKRAREGGYRALALVAPELHWSLGPAQGTSASPHP